MKRHWSFWNERSRISKVSWKFRIPTIYIIYPWNLLFPWKVACFLTISIVFSVSKTKLCGLITWLFHDGGRRHIETSPLICSANQWTGFYMTTASVMKDLKTREAMNAKIPVFVIYVEATIYLLLYYLHDSSILTKQKHISFINYS